MRKSSRGNPNHYPKGHPKGGQFAPKGVGMSINHTQEYYDVRTSYRGGEMDNDEYQKKIAELRELSKEEEQHLFRRQVSFTPAKTISEAEDYARNTLGVRPYYKGLPLEVANTCNQCLTETFAQFPELKEEIKVIGSGQQINKEIKAKLSPIIQRELQAIYGGTYPQSAIDRAAKKSVNQYVSNMGGYAYYKQIIVRKDEEKSRIAKSYGGIYLNERNVKDTEDMKRSYEHDVKNLFHPVGTDVNPMKSILDHELGHAIDYKYGISDKVSITRNSAEVKLGLSRYATESKREYIAEAWEEYRNNEKPRPIAMEVGRIIDSVGIKQ